jgi:hypothetical protein
LTAAASPLHLSDRHNTLVEAGSSDSAADIHFLFLRRSYRIPNTRCNHARSHCHAHHSRNPGRVAHSLGGNTVAVGAAVAGSLVEGAVLERRDHCRVSAAEEGSRIVRKPWFEAQRTGSRPVPFAHREAVIESRGFACKP